MKYFNLVAAAVFICVYALGNIPPSERFNLWLVPFAIPFALVFNIVLLVVALLRFRRSSLFLLAALVAGGNYLLSSVAVKPWFNRPNAGNSALFSVLSYNVGDFNVGFFPEMDEEGWIRAIDVQKSMIDWMLDNDADIQCYQEFPRILAQGDVDLVKLFENRGLNVYFSGESRLHPSNVGILTVSRFPILASGDILASENGFNRISYVDVLTGKDTIRVINTHLQSMQLKSFNPLYSEDFEAQRRDAKMVYRRLKNGVFERSRQIGELTAFIAESPHPVICVGDFNELPYSYSYGEMKKYLKNAFEESGRGFGFSYNGKTLSTLRIDNQFYSEGITSLRLHTLNTVTYSDHFPLLGVYGGYRVKKINFQQRFINPGYIPAYTALSQTGSCGYANVTCRSANGCNEFQKK